MSAVRIVMVLWGGLFLVLETLKPPGDGDLWWQRWLGETILRTHQLPHALGPETFSAAGAPWVPQEWLLSLMVALSMDARIFIVLKVAVALLVVGILASVYLRSRNRASPEAIAVALLLCGGALQSSFGVRAQVLGWGCFAAFLVLLERRDKWYFLTIPTVVLWANVHASALLAPVFLAARIASDAADGHLRGRSKSRDVLLLPFVTLALFCTPFGWHLPAYAIELSTSPIRHYIQEWQPVSITTPDFLFGPLPLALLVAAASFRVLWGNKREALPVLMLFVAMILARRNEALFAIAAAPLAAVGLDVRFPRWRNVGKKAGELERFAIVATCIAFVLSGLAFAKMRAQAPPTVPVAAFAMLGNDGGTHRVFCNNFSDCSLALQYPNLRVFMDGRCDPYPLRVWKTYVAIIQAESEWSPELHRFGVDAVVAARSSALAKSIADAGWRRAFDDGAFVVFEKT